MTDSYTDFPFITDEKTIKHIGNSKVLFLIRGLPGSGKSSIVKLLKEKYTGKSVVCSSDDFWIQEDGSYKWCKEKLSEAHEWCQAKARDACKANTPVVIIDKTNVKRSEWDFFVEVANLNSYTVVLVSPKTPWCLDAVELAKRNVHSVPVEAVEVKKKDFVNAYVCPLYWGWFLNEQGTDVALGLAGKYFKLVVDHCKDFADFMKSKSKSFL